MLPWIADLTKSGSCWYPPIVPLGNVIVRALGTAGRLRAPRARAFDGHGAHQRPSSHGTTGGAGGKGGLVIEPLSSAAMTDDQHALTPSPSPASGRGEMLSGAGAPHKG